MMARRQATTTVGLLLLSLVMVVASVKDSDRPFRRMQKTTSASSGAASTGTGTTSTPVASVTAPLGSVEKLMFLKDVLKTGGKIDPLEVMTAYAQGSQFQKLYSNVGVQRKIVLDNPMLSVMPGFKKIAEGKLGDAETVAAFKEGVKNLLAFSKSAAAVNENPSAAALDAVKELAKSSDPDIQALLQAARGGDSDALEKLQGLAAKALYPDIDFQALKNVAENHTFERVLKSPEMMHFVDMDPHLSAVFREGSVLPSTHKARRALEGATAAVNEGQTTGEL